VVSAEPTKPNGCDEETSDEEETSEEAEAHAEAHEGTKPAFLERLIWK